MISIRSATRDYINLIYTHSYFCEVIRQYRLVYLLGNSFLKTKSESEILKTHGLKKHQFLLQFFILFYRRSA